MAGQAQHHSQLEELPESEHHAAMLHGTGDCLSPVAFLMG